MDPEDLDFEDEELEGRNAPKKLRGEHVAALRAYLTHGTIAAAVRATQEFGEPRSGRSIRRWLAKPGPFRDAVQAAAATSLKDCAFLITLSLQEAITADREIIKDREAPHSVKVQATGHIIQIAKHLSILKSDGSEGGEDSPSVEEWKAKQGGDVPL